MTTMILNEKRKNKGVLPSRKKPRARQVSVEEVESYMAMDYPITLIKDEDDYVASHPDLPGCVSFGSTPTEACESLVQVKRLWIEGQLSGGAAIPRPPEPESFSGKFVLRIAKQLHSMVDKAAREEGVSLNTYISNVLAGAVGFPRPLTPAWDFAFQYSERTDWWDLPLRVQGLQTTALDIWTAVELTPRISQDPPLAGLGKVESYQRSASEQLKPEEYLRAHDDEIHFTAE
jgi:predicted RNase H-like HicB family nuclease